MSDPRLTAWARRALAWKIVRRVAVPAVLYLVLGWLFAYETASQGFLSPGGAPHAGVVLLGAFYLAARIGFRFAFPAIVTYACVDALWRRVALGRVKGNGEVGR